MFSTARKRPRSTGFESGQKHHLPQNPVRAVIEYVPGAILKWPTSSTSTSPAITARSTTPRPIWTQTGRAHAVAAAGSRGRERDDIGIPGGRAQCRSSESMPKETSHRDASAMKRLPSRRTNVTSKPVARSVHAEEARSNAANGRDSGCERLTFHPPDKTARPVRAAQHR